MKPEFKEITKKLSEKAKDNLQKQFDNIWDKRFDELCNMDMNEVFKPKKKKNKLQ